MILKKTSYFFSLSLFVVISFSLSAQLQNKPYRVYLKPGKILIDPKTKEEKQITRGVFAMVAETNLSRSDEFIVYNKKGEPTYLTSPEGIVEFEEDVALLPDDKADVVYPPRSTLKTYNKIALIDSQFNYHLDIMSTAPLSTLYSQNMNSTMTHRFEVRSFYLGELPVDFGLALNYQTGYWKNDIESFSLSILSLGPHLKKTVYEQDEFSLSAHFGAEYAPVYRSSSGDAIDHFHGVILNFGAETIWQSDLGRWTVGAQMRRHDLSLSESTRAGVNEEPKEFVLSSLSLTLGYRLEWDYK